jgi:hypothetical protein
MFRNDEPDFRKMTPDEIRRDIMKLSTEIARLKKINPDHLSFFIDELEQQRKRYKEVWRARPGRKQFNVAARREREKQRKRENFRRKFPFIP